MPSLSEAGYTPGEPEEEVDYIASNPNKQLGFEIDPQRKNWSFAPEFYPEDFTQMKKKELSRYGGGCGGESVSIKTIKNREFHVTGYLLEGEINIFQALLDHSNKIDLLSPLTPAGGMECFVKRGELGNQKGWDPHTQQWIFDFTLDLVSTGRDERSDDGRNEIVTAIMDGAENDSISNIIDVPSMSETDESVYEGLPQDPSQEDVNYLSWPRTFFGYTGDEQFHSDFRNWERGDLSTERFNEGKQPQDQIPAALVRNGL